MPKGYLTYSLPEGLEPKMDRAEVGRRLGVTKEAIRTLEVKALRKLQAYCQARGLTLSDFIPDDRL